MVTFSDIPGLFDENGGTGGGSGGSTPGSTPGTNSLRIYDPTTGERDKNMDYEISWSYIEKSIRSGTISPNARVGDVEIVMGHNITAYNLGEEVAYASAGLIMRKQVDENSIEELEIMGLQFTNWVYDGKSVVISAWDAFYKKDEEGFIIPLNQQILRQMSLRDVTQMSFECTHLVFNCYQIVKTKWYQKGWFKIVLIIIAIIITVVTWGAAGPAAGSALGAVYAGLTAVGVAALMASIITATIAVLAGMLLMKLLMPVAVELFGEKWGAVIATIVAVVTMNWASTGSMLGGLANAPLNATTIIQGTSAIVGLVGAYQQGALQEFMKENDIALVSSEAEARMEEINKLTKELLDNNLDMIDIPEYLKATEIQMESPATFLTRTLMTGSDVADVTRGLIEDFVEVNLLLPNQAANS